MKIKRSVVILLLCFILITIVFVGCDKKSSSTQELIEHSIQDTLMERYISYPKELDDGDIVELEVPTIVLIDVRGNDKEEIAENFKTEFEQQGIYMDDIYVNEDGKVIMVLSKVQMEEYICFVNNKLKKAYCNDIPWDTSNVSIEIKEDFSCVNYYVTEECELLEYSFMIMWIEPSLAVAQTIQGIPCDKWRVKHKIYFRNEEITMFEFESGAGITYEITNEEWEQKMEEAKKLAEGDD